MGGHAGGRPIRGQVSYHLSVFEQRAFDDIAKYGLSKIFRKVRHNFWDVVPAFGFGIGVYLWSHSYHEKLAREHRS